MSTTRQKTDKHILIPTPDILDQNACESWKTRENNRPFGLESLELRVQEIRNVTFYISPSQSC